MLYVIKYQKNPLCNKISKLEWLHGVDSIFTLLMDRMETMQKGAPHVQLHILRLPTLSWLEALKVKSGYLFFVGRQLFRHNPTEDQYIPAMHNSWGFVWRDKLVTKI